MNAISNIHAAACGMLALSICPKALKDALAAMRASGGAQIVEKRNTIPILGCVLLDAQPDKLTLHSTDLDVQLAIELPCAADGCGRVAIDFEALHKAAKGAKGETVRLVDMGGADSHRQGRVTFQHDGGTATLPTRAADDFPFIAAPAELALFALDGPTLKRDLDRTATCISTEETRYYLNGVFFHLTRLAPPLDRTAEHNAAVDERAQLRDAQARHECAERQRAEPIVCEETGTEPDTAETVATRLARMAELDKACEEFEAVRCAPDSLCMAATDGHRLARIARPIPADAPPAMLDVILPSKSAHWIRKVGLKGCEGDAYLGFSGSKFVFQRGRMRLVSKLVDGTFPDYSRVIPAPPYPMAPRGIASDSHVIGVSADALADAATQAAGHLAGRTHAFTLSVGEGWATAYATCPDNGAASAVIDGTSYAPKPGEDVGEGFAAGFNAKYLADLMSAGFKGQDVTISMQDSTAPARIDCQATPEFLAVVMPMRVGMDTGIMSPDALRKMNRDALEIFAEDMPAKLTAIAKVEAMVADGTFSKREAGDMLKQVRRAAGETISDAVDLLARHSGAGLTGEQVTARWPETRYAARLSILRDVAAMKGEGDPLIERARRAKADAGGGMAPDEPAPCGPIYGGAAGQPAVIYFMDELPEPQSPQPEPVESQPDEPEGEAIDAPRQPDEPQAETAGECSARLRGEAPMFATLQAFKAAAGQGSRWIIDNWNETDGWSGERVRTVATVRARDIGFLGEDATLDQCHAADVRGGDGRAWVGFPKQPDWESTPEGLVIFYPACEQSGRAAKEIPCIRLRPVPIDVDTAIEPEQGEETAPDRQPGEIAELRAIVAELSARMAAMEAGGVPLEAVAAVSAPVAAVDALETPVRRSPAHERAIRRAWTERTKRRQAEADVAFLDRCHGIAGERAERAEGLVARLSVRVARLTAVLTGRKRQIAALGRDLLVARNRAGDLRSAGQAVPPLASVPAAPTPPRVDVQDDADRYAVAC